MNHSSNALKPLLARARESLAYDTEGVKLEFTEQLVARMEAAGVSKSALAARLDVAPAYVTKVLQGTTNFTLESMVKIARALGAELQLQLKPVKSGLTLRRNMNAKAIHANGASRRNRETIRAAPKNAV
ncbi:MAG: helix-turn-helix transcriptional regulator [Verrucomicrobia bacterium]|nr:helix-turn-helix transcriptional regulator [Verrucomicrobiota bacterium]